ncbi:unnamed protein product [Cylindrotheca closterium]|uniref:Uncharacterized protein n=1 Tax=Cylindrotheca closterium TaxID=2856 RepID=A0AAD2G037_9STRA|nr:unnamed protein product [Cylindrotheca closterium]
MDNVAKACSQLEQSDARLTLLNLNCEFIGTPGVQKLAKSCHKCQVTSREIPIPHSPLAGLWLEANDVYPRGAEAVSQILQCSPELKYLYVSNNNFGNSGVAHLAHAASRQLDVCHIGDNKIDHIGARVIADVLLGEASVVRTLVLDGNNLGNEGATIIAEGLRKNKNLAKLDLRNNRIDKAGMLALLQVLKNDNMTLQYLMLQETDEGCSRHAQSPLDKSPRPRKQSNFDDCTCERCQILFQMDYFLAMNRAGRHSLADVMVPANLWPRILSNVSHSDPSLRYAMLSFYKPNIVPGHP